jgi:hypothetical protein
MQGKISFISFLITALYIVIFGIVWRWGAARLSQKPVGQAMAVIY